jgi:hypothetical protein
MVTILKPHRRRRGDAIEAGRAPDEKEGVEVDDSDEDASQEDDTGTASAPGEGPNPTA